MTLVHLDWNPVYKCYLYTIIYASLIVVLFLAPWWWITKCGSYSMTTERWAQPHVGRRSGPKIAELPGSWELLCWNWAAKRDAIAVHPLFSLLRRGRRKEGSRWHHPVYSFFWLSLAWSFTLSEIIFDLTHSILLLSLKLRCYDGVSKLLTQSDSTRSTIYIYEVRPRGNLHALIEKCSQTAQRSLRHIHISSSL